jgi:hypothetical protein
MKKGISPLISWVLLVAMSIAIGSIVYMWAINLGHNINVENPQDLYCDNTHLKALGVCRDQNLLLMNLSNTGSYNITSITFYKDTESTVPGSCIVLLEPALKPGTIISYTINVDKEFSNESFDQCEENPISIPSSTNVTELSVIPWVYQDNKNTDCPDSKIILNKIDTNTLCVN